MIPPSAFGYNNAIVNGGKFKTRIGGAEMKHTKKCAVVVAVVLLMIGATPASALLEVHSGSVSFESDLEPNKDINLPSFDVLGGTRILNSVLVELFHSGSVSMLADNDDGFNTAQINAHIVRIWAATGPGVIGFGNETVTSPVVTLQLEDGDGATFDATPPDGKDFSGTTAYSNLLAGSFNPSTALYTTDGPGTVTFTVYPQFMVNYLQFVIPADQWQMEVQNPDLTVTAKVTYSYVPEPATIALLGLSSMALIKKRRL
ncbi:hypothetical protein ES708_30761 [subsurface metagenome]